MARLKGGVQLNEVGVVQLVHHLDLISHHLLTDRNTSKLWVITFQHGEMYGGSLITNLQSVCK